MIIRQLSVFLENKPGRLCAAIDELAKAGVNISALSLADAAEYGILRLIVDQPDVAKEVLTASGVIVKTHRVIALAMNDEPGGAGTILHLLAGAGVNIEYMYACVGHVTGKALMVVRTDNAEKAEQALLAGGFIEINPADI
ncbi:MAG: hypothetical protein J6X61_00945 [Clostridia bacterium]|nr:hypothetical protein [Clostridia bacterium]